MNKKCRNCGALNVTDAETCIVCDMPMDKKEHVKHAKATQETSPDMFVETINDRIANISSQIDLAIKTLTELKNQVKELKK